ncbi:hypothetical protein ACLOJK_025027 [Asimina triloba]
MEEDTSLGLQLHKLSASASEVTVIDHILDTLWKTRRTGLGSHQKSYIQSLLNLPSSQELDPFRPSGKCVHDGLNGDDIQKLFPIDLPLELQRTLMMLLQKYQNMWKEEASREQRMRISSQVKVGAPSVTLPFPASEVVSPMWPRQDDGARNLNQNCQSIPPLAAESNMPLLASVSLHSDDSRPDNLAILPCLKSMTWTMENRKSTPSKRVAVITLKLQDFSKNPSGETEVKFQLSRDTLEAMLRSMAYIREQLSNAIRFLELQIITENFFKICEILLLSLCSSEIPSLTGRLFSNLSRSPFSSSHLHAMEPQPILLQQWPACRLQTLRRVYILTLSGADDHRFNPSSIDNILSALKLVAEAPDAGALVTTNDGRFFSNGLDLRWIGNNLAHSSLDVIRDKFEGMLGSFMKSGIPTIAAICGHASAGGFMLALLHDYRFMRKDKGVLYMSELDHGMFMPRSLMSTIKSKLSAEALREVVLKARKFRASEALEFKIVDGVFEDAASTLGAAVAEAEKLAARGWNKESYANLRNVAFPQVLEEIEARRDAYVWRLGSASKL